ncbi:MAG: ComF family protein, partial [Anaerolineae bacterium]
VDDLCTTGATLQACAASLRQAGVGSVWAFTLARPHWEAGNAIDSRRETGYNEMGLASKTA